MKTLVLYHRVDLDGWMSAAIVKKDFLEKNPEKHLVINLDSDERHKVDSEKGVTRHMTQDVDYNSLYMKGFQYGDPLPVLEGYDSIILVDISLPTDVMVEMYNKLKQEFVYIDHHKAKILEFYDEIQGRPISGLRNFSDYEPTKLAACELTWRYFFSEEIPDIVTFLGAYDCFRHKSFEEEKSLDILRFQYGARAELSSYNDCYNVLELQLQNSNNGKLLSNGKAIYGFLYTEAKLIYASKEDVILYEPILEGGTTSVVKFAIVNRNRFNPVNFGIDYHKDGYDGFACFWVEKGKYHFSIYNDNGKVNCASIAKTFGGGGHDGASGFVLTQKQFNSLNIK